MYGSEKRFVSMQRKNDVIAITTQDRAERVSRNTEIHTDIFPGILLFTNPYYSINFIPNTNVSDKRNKSACVVKRSDHDKV